MNLLFRILLILISLSALCLTFSRSFREPLDVLQIALRAFDYDLIYIEIVFTTVFAQSFDQVDQSFVASIDCLYYVNFLH